MCPSEVSVVGTETRHTSLRAGVLLPSCTWLLSTGLCPLPPVGVNQPPDLESSEGQSLNSFTPCWFVLSSGQVVPPLALHLGCTPQGPTLTVKPPAPAPRQKASGS